jgi:hypothetical protein
MFRERVMTSYACARLAPSSRNIFTPSPQLLLVAFWWWGEPSICRPYKGCQRPSSSRLWLLGIDFGLGRGGRHGGAELGEERDGTVH